MSTIDLRGRDLLGIELSVLELKDRVERQFFHRVVVSERQSVRRVGKKQGSVRAVDHVVRRVQLFSLEVIDDGRDRHVAIDAHDAPVSMLAKHRGAVLARRGSVRPDVAAGRQAIAVVAARPENLDHLAVGRPLTHHIAHDVAEPERAERAPERTFDERESAGKLFDLCVLRNKRIKGGVEPHDMSDRGRYWCHKDSFGLVLKMTTLYQPLKLCKR